jgi:hypothetical protein
MGHGKPFKRKNQQKGWVGWGGEIVVPSPSASASLTVRRQKQVLNICESRYPPQLWSVLHRVESYSELCFGLQSVLDRIKREELRPFVYANSKTKLAAIVRDIVRGGRSGDEAGKKGVD